MATLDDIDLFVIVMLENRSFDHMLGYLSLPPWNRADVEGLSPGLHNNWNGKNYPVIHLKNPNASLEPDPPHSRYDIALQLRGLPGPAGPPPHPMIGFVSSFAEAGAAPDVLGDIMGYYTGEELHFTDFAARNFAICDHWFSPLPAGTQPNRLMALSGFTRIDVNQSVILERQDTVFDWLEARGIGWRLYHQGVPFITMMDEWHLRVLTDEIHFRDYDDFLDDIQHEGDITFPKVVFIDPRFTDAPHVETPSDDHPPTPVISGQNFLSKIYLDITSNPSRWARTLMIVTYDEHGGFYDHVSPLAINTSPPKGVNYPVFESTGVRVPAYALSPWVAPGSCIKTPLDHTSILKMLGEKFGGGTYSPDVDARTVASASAVLNAPAPSFATQTPVPFGRTPAVPPTGEIPKAFADAIELAKAQNPRALMAKFPEVYSYKL